MFIYNFNCLEGGVTENFEFQLDDDTDVYRSCSATLNGEIFVFGGKRDNKMKQVLYPLSISLRLNGFTSGFQSYRLWTKTYWWFDLRFLLWNLCHLLFSTTKNNALFFWLLQKQMRKVISPSHHESLRCEFLSYISKKKTKSAFSSCNYVIFYLFATS